MAIYLFISLWLGISALFPVDSPFKNRHVSKVFTFLLIALMLAYIPFWNVYVSDMVRYVAAFQNMHYLSLPQVLQNYDWEPLFLVSQWVISRFTQDQVLYVLFTFILFIGLLYKAITNLFVPWQRTFAVFVFLSYPFFYMYVFDGIRQGVAMLLIILAVSFWIKKKNSLWFYLCLISAGFFHNTAFIMAIVIGAILLLKLRFRTIMVVWSITAFLFVTGLNAEILNIGFITNINKIQEYTGSELMGTFGGDVNKLNFFIFTTFFLFASIFLYKYLILEETYRKVYLLLIKTYAGFSSVFLLFGFIAYSNRIAMYSWFLIPLLMSYPILYKKQPSKIFLFLMVLVSFATSFLYSPFIVFK